MSKISIEIFSNNPSPIFQISKNSKNAFWTKIGPLTLCVNNKENISEFFFTKNCVFHGESFEFLTEEKNSRR